MKLRSELPHVAAICRDGSSWLLPIESLETFETAWTNGRAFWSGTNYRGARVTIKLADITGTVENTAEIIAHLEAEKEEEQRRKLLAGGE